MGSKNPIFFVDTAFQRLLSCSLVLVFSPTAIFDPSERTVFSGGERKRPSGAAIACSATKTRMVTYETFPAFEFVALRPRLMAPPMTFLPQELAGFLTSE